MKSAAVSRKQKNGKLNGRTLVLALALLAMMVMSWGCSSMHHPYPGESWAEANRRHKRVLRLNSQGLLADIDAALLMDRPSHLTDQRLP
jgi:hypothetical protein